MSTGAKGKEPHESCLQYWQACGQLEALSLLGQTWFAGFCAAALLEGAWTAPSGMGSAVALVFLGHLNALAGLGRLGLAMTAPPVPGSSPAAGVSDAAIVRTSAIARSRALYALGLIAAAAGSLVQGVTTQPTWVPWIVLAAILFPWFSLAPRWRLESPLLRQVSGFSKDSSIGRVGS